MHYIIFSISENILPFTINFNEKNFSVCHIWQLSCHLLMRVWQCVIILMNCISLALADVIYSVTAYPMFHISKKTEQRTTHLTLLPFHFSSCFHKYIWARAFGRLNLWELNFYHFFLKIYTFIWLFCILTYSLKNYICVIMYVR